MAEINKCKYFLHLIHIVQAIIDMQAHTHYLDIYYFTHIFACLLAFNGEPRSEGSFRKKSIGTGKKPMTKVHVKFNT